MDQGGNLLRIPLDGASSPMPELKDGTVALFEGPGGEREVAIQVYTFETIDSAMDESGAMPVGTMIDEVIAATPLQRSSDTSAWYYVRLPFGRSVLAGGLTLMLVVLPVVIISAQEALRGVPNTLREGALAAGATRWQMVSRMTLPASIPGIMTGSILAMSRAIGEAAPILVIAGIVFILFRPQNVMDDFTAMPLQIYNWAGEPQPSFHKVAATGIVVLLTILLSFNALAVLIRQKFQKPLQ
jgi:phosphate transport system permease protein